MAHFHGLCHGNCALRYIGGVLELRKLDFRGLRVQFNVKKGHFRGLITKIGYLRLILASIMHLWAIFIEKVTVIVLLGILDGF